MIGSVLALGGWLAAAAALAFGIGCWRSRALRMEAVTRACHELRGPITAARLGLVVGARGSELSGARVRAIDLELGRAALALDDLTGAGERGRARPGRGGRAGAGGGGRAGAGGGGRARMGGGRAQTGGAHESVDVAQLLRDAVEASRAGAAEAGVGVELTWTGGVANVPGDRLRIAQTVRNLIANAIEHGGGAVRVRGSEHGDGARVEVIDCGPGLPAPVAELARRARGGRGLRGRGLAIASSIAAAHGGRLASAPSERGARLVLELPGGVGEAPGRPAPGEELPPA